MHRPVTYFMLSLVKGLTRSCVPDSGKGADYMMKFMGSLVYYLLVTTILCLPALYNGYPVVYHDVCAYLKVGFSLMPDADRFLGYGLFLSVATLRSTLWTVIFIQGLIVSLLLFQVTKKISGGRSPYLFHLLVIIVLTTSTGVGWYVSTPMPDVFAAGVILAIFLIVVEPASRKLKLSLLLFLLLFFEISHFSHILLAFLLIAALAAAFSLSVVKRKYLPRLFLAFVTTVISVIFLMAHNYFRGNGFVPSLSSNVFFTARLCDTPILKHYLEENDDQTSLSLVKFRDDLPDSYSKFLWDPESPFRRVYGIYGRLSPTGAFEHANHEYKIIVRDILLTPRYLFPLLKENLRATVRQLAHIRVTVPLIIYTKDNTVYKVINNYFPGETDEFLQSRQNRGLLKFTFFNPINIYILILAVAIIVFCFISGRMGETSSLLVWVVILGVFLNAAVTASFAMVNDRFQARVSWLIVYAGLLCGWAWWGHRPRGVTGCSSLKKS